MAVLDSFVEVYITRQTAQIDTASFNIPLILSSHSAFPERYRTYSDIEGVAEDFAITDKAYIMANAVFSQQLRPVTLAIGRVQQTYPHLLLLPRNGKNKSYHLPVKYLLRFVFPGQSDLYVIL